MGHSTQSLCKWFQINERSPFSNHTQFQSLPQDATGGHVASRREQGNSGRVCTSGGLVAFLNTRHSGNPPTTRCQNPARFSTRQVGMTSANHFCAEHMLLFSWTSDLTKLDGVWGYHSLPQRRQKGKELLSDVFLQGKAFLSLTPVRI